MKHLPINKDILRNPDILKFLKQDLSGAKTAILMPTEFPTVSLDNWEKYFIPGTLQHEHENISVATLEGDELLHTPILMGVIVLDIQNDKEEFLEIEFGGKLYLDEEQNALKYFCRAQHGRDCHFVWELKAA